MVHEGLQEVLFSLHLPKTLSGSFGELGVCFWGPVCQGVVLAISPEIFHRVEFRGIGWEEEMREFCGIGFQEGGGGFGLVSIQEVPDEEERSPSRPSELSEEIDTEGRADILEGMEAEEKSWLFALWVDGQSSDGRDLGMGAPFLAQDRGLALGGPASPQERTHQDSGLIDENEPGLFLPGFFLMRGQV